MSTRTATWLAWSLCAVGVALLALTVLLDYYYTPPFSNRIDWNDYAFFADPYSPPFPNRGNGNVYAFFALPLLVYTTVGAFVASRRPKNLVGWLLCVIGLIFAAEGFGIAYADYALLAQAGSWLPDGVYIASISQNLLMLPALSLTAILLILLFPDGHLPDRSWRAVPWVATGGVCCGPFG